jgi:hypothetical protein
MNVNLLVDITVSYVDILPESGGVSPITTPVKKNMLMVTSWHWTRDSRAESKERARY